MSVTILRGVPGSGKSTYIRNIWKESLFPVLRCAARADFGRDGVLLSADDYFTHKETGEYRFDRSMLGAAHARCLKEFTEFIRLYSDNCVIAVDNTNTTNTELAPYAALALAYGHTLEVVTLLCDPEIAAARNVHGVPRKTVLDMDKRLRSSLAHVPPYWTSRVIES